MLKKNRKEKSELSKGWLEAGPQTDILFEKVLGECIILTACLMLLLPVEGIGGGNSKQTCKLSSIVEELLQKSQLGLFKTLNCLLLAPVLQCPLTLSFMEEHGVMLGI